MSTPDVLLAGLPSTGKTTYLALAYTAIVMDPNGLLQLGSFKGDREYLNQISQALEACVVAEHTEVDAQGELVLPLRIGDAERSVRIPDVSGETWEEALDSRAWHRSFDDRVATCGGFMLFLHSTNVEMGGTILDADALEDVLLNGTLAAGDADGPIEGADGQVDLDVPADLKNAADGSDDEGTRERATQVDAVDLLQIVAQRNRQRPLRLSIVISAWERVVGRTPQQWLDETLHLLRQYLQNSSTWETTVWGVSAQGGDFTDDKAKEDLLKKSVIERAVVEAADGQPSSIHDPLLWVLGLE